MATSNISSLGLGSDGVLSYDVIDQLRAVDERAQLTPITKKLETNDTKQKDLSTLVTMTASLKSATSILADEMSYLKRNTSVSDTALSVNASAGVALQDFTLHIEQLAQRDIYQSKGYISADTALGLSEDTFTFKVGTQEYSIHTSSTSSLNQLKDAINDIASQKLTASVLNVGGESPYRLVLKSNETGKTNTIEFISGLAIEDLKLDKPKNHLQNATDAQIVYNGVEISRPNNVIDDLILGVQITLHNKHATDASSQVLITQDTSDIKQGIETLVKSFNELITNLNASTKYDKDSEVAGTFQGINQINALSNSIRQQLLLVDRFGINVSSYGISLNENGYLDFDTALFNQKMANNPHEVATFFHGKKDDVDGQTEGFFSNFNTLLANYIDSNKGILTLYQNSLVSEKTLLQKEQETTIERLDQRYEAMAARFASYDSLINRLNNQFNALSMMIEASYQDTK